MISTEEEGLTGRQQLQWSVIQQRTNPLKVRNGNPTASHSRNAYPGVTCFKCRFIEERAVILLHDGPFAAERPCGTKSPNCRANDALGHVEHVPHLLSSFAIFVPRDCSTAKSQLCLMPLNSEQLEFPRVIFWAR